MRRRAAPDRDAAIAQYRRRAWSYDLEIAAFEAIRRDTVAALGLRKGWTVLDVGCGTGLSLPLLCAGVGRHGRVVGVEQSPAMAERARQRIARLGLRGAEVVCTPVEAFVAAQQADAALFVFTHDVLQSAAAVDRVVAALKHGGRVAACGLQWARPALSPVNLAVWLGAKRSVTTLAGLDAPWRALATHCRDWHVEPRLFGALYLGSGLRR